MARFGQGPFERCPGRLNWRPGRIHVPIRQERFQIGSDSVAKVCDFRGGDFAQRRGERAIIKALGLERIAKTVRHARRQPNRIRPQQRRERIRRHAGGLHLVARRLE